MRLKLDCHQYKSLEEFESDLKLVWNNAMTYNQKDTIYYRAAVRIRDVGKKSSTQTTLYKMKILVILSTQTFYMT